MDVATNRDGRPHLLNVRFVDQDFLRLLAKLLHLELREGLTREEHFDLIVQGLDLAYVEFVLFHFAILSLYYKLPEII